MGDAAELDAIRAKRMADLQEKAGGVGSLAGLPPGLADGGAGAAQAAQQEQQRRQQMEERRQMMLGQILSPEAQSRISRIALVREEKARAVEDMLIQAAQFGQIQGRVSEEKLVEMLSQVNNRMEKKTKITINRRRFADSEDEDDDDDDDDDDAEDDDDYWD